MNRIILNETSYFGAGCRSVIAVEAARRGFTPGESRKYITVLKF